MTAYNTYNYIPYFCKAEKIQGSVTSNIILLSRKDTLVRYIKQKYLIT